MKSLREIQTTLRTALGNDALFTLLNTRVTLRTGVDLNSIQPTDDTDRTKVEKVEEVLTALGFSPSSLQLVAQKKSGRT